MYTANKTCHPLLRGVLTELFAWQDDPDCPGYQRRYCQIAVWCPFCREFHHHGWNPAYDGRHAEHRVAHCHSDDSPFNGTGYFITVLRRCDPGFAAHVVVPGREIIRAIPAWELERRRREAERAAERAAAICGGAVPGAGGNLLPDAKGTPCPSTAETASGNRGEPAENLIKITQISVNVE